MAHFLHMTRNCYYREGYEVESEPDTDDTDILFYMCKWEALCEFKFFSESFYVEYFCINVGSQPNVFNPSI